MDEDEYNLLKSFDPKRIKEYHDDGYDLFKVGAKYRYMMLQKLLVRGSEEEIDEAFQLWPLDTPTRKNILGDMLVYLIGVMHPEAICKYMKKASFYNCASNRGLLASSSILEIIWIAQDDFPIEMILERQPLIEDRFLDDDHNIRLIAKNLVRKQQSDDTTFFIDSMKKTLMMIFEHCKQGNDLWIPTRNHLFPAWIQSLVIQTKWIISNASVFYNLPSEIQWLIVEFVLWSIIRDKRPQFIRDMIEHPKNAEEILNQYWKKVEMFAFIKQNDYRFAF